MKDKVTNEIVCKLTGAKGPGVRAHIIPRSFYDFGNPVHKPAKIIQLAGEKSTISTSQIGEYDEGIVTKDGEDYFSVCDTYAWECLVKRGQDGKLYHDSLNPLCIEISDFDYPKLKMFFISLLWRAGVSSRALFRRVNLGPHEDRLRELILANNPGTPHDYSVMLGIHRDTPDHGLPMLEPFPLRDEKTGIKYYRFSLGRLVACIKVDSQPYGHVWEDFVLKDGGALRYIILDDFKTSSLYKSLRQEVQRIFNGRPPFCKSRKSQ
jgi:hypothetical protein